MTFGVWIEFYLGSLGLIFLVGMIMTMTWVHVWLVARHVRSLGPAHDVSGMRSGPVAPTKCTETHAIQWARRTSNPSGELQRPKPVALTTYDTSLGKFFRSKHRGTPLAAHARTHARTPIIGHSSFLTCFGPNCRPTPVVTPKYLPPPRLYVLSLT